MPDSVFINGKYICAKGAALSIFSPGFLYGDGVFETLKSCSKEIIFFDEHIDRLFSSLRELKYSYSCDREHIKSAILKLIAKNRLNNCNAAIKIIVSRRNYIDKFRIDFWAEPDLIITAKKIANYQKDIYKKGLIIISSSIRRNPCSNFLYKHKLLNYFENIYAKNEAYAAGADEALFITRDKTVLECASSNIFLVKNGSIITPALTQNILPGITRQNVINICKKNNINIIQKKVHYFEIMEADEIFITNSISDIMPVKMVDSHTIAKCNIPGKATELVSVLYRQACL